MRHMFAHHIVTSLRQQIGFRRQGETVDDAIVAEFLAAAIWEIPVGNFVVVVGIDATRRGGMR